MKRARAIEFAVRPRAEWHGSLWRALAADLRWQIDTGRLPAGSRLPSIRTAARLLHVSRTTMEWAFESLIADGYAGAHVGDGTYVLDVSCRVGPPLWRRRRRWMRDPDGLLLWLVRDR